MKQVTSFDVARLAGVSQPTVSRALRNMPGTSTETRAKVLQAAAELSYIVSDSARVLSTTKTHRIAVVSEELTNPYYPELVEPLRRYLAEHDLRAVVVTDTGQTGIQLAALADGSYDGVILTTTARRSTLPRDLTERRIPHVLVNRILDSAESPSCSIDNAGGMAAIAKLLADLGHSRVGAIHGPVETSTGRERSEALRRALSARGVYLRREMVVRTDFSHDAGYRAALQLLAIDRPPTALVCGNDVVALGALSAAKEIGIRIPDDLTVIGFDDIPMAAWPLIGLTTVRCDLDRMAKTSVSMLLDEIDRPSHSPTVERIDVRLQERRTHGRPGSR